jgi:hypothetical protein
MTFLDKFVVMTWSGGFHEAKEVVLCRDDAIAGGGEGGGWCVA